MAAPSGHDWHFMTAETGSGMEGGGVAVVVAVCERCGLIRTVVAAPNRDSKIDLSGECESKPDRTAHSF